MNAVVTSWFNARACTIWSVYFGGFLYTVKFIVRTSTFSCKSFLSLIKSTRNVLQLAMASTRFAVTGKAKAGYHPLGLNVEKPLERNSGYIPRNIDNAAKLAELWPPAGALPRQPI